MLINKASVAAIITPHGSVLAATESRTEFPKPPFLICVEITLLNLPGGLRGGRMCPLKLTEEGMNMGSL